MCFNMSVINTFMSVRLVANMATIWAESGVNVQVIHVCALVYKALRERKGPGIIRVCNLLSEWISLISIILG